MHHFVTGGAGFVGSHLVDRLLARGDRVTAYDNFSTGFREFLGDALGQERFTLVEGDVLDSATLSRAMAGSDFVHHMAANADVRFGPENPQRDLEQNTIATSRLLEAMRANGVKRLSFASTGSVYGEPATFPTPEDAPFPVQTSFYGASKLACEGLIGAYGEAYGFKAWIFRFVSVLGERYTHGHVRDFVTQLGADPGRLQVLGNGRQAKSYMHVDDCIAGMLVAMDRAEDKVNLLNLGTDAYARVDDSIAWICAVLGVNPKITYGGGERGWVGDSPFIHLDIGRMRALGWRPRIGIREGVERTVRWLRANAWVVERRR